MISLRFNQLVQRYKMKRSDAQKQNRCKEKKETTQTQSKMALVLTRSWPASLSSHCCVKRGEIIKTNEVTSTVTYGRRPFNCTRAYPKTVTAGLPSRDKALQLFFALKEVLNQLRQ